MQDKSENVAVENEYYEEFVYQENILDKQKEFKQISIDATAKRKVKK